MIDVENCFQDLQAIDVCFDCGDSDGCRKVSYGVTGANKQYLPKQKLSSDSSIKLEYDSASNIDSICRPLSDLSLEKRPAETKSKLKMRAEAQISFKDEADLSKRVISKLPCIKSCNKRTVLKDLESVKELPEFTYNSSENAHDKFYRKIPNPADAVITDLAGHKYLQHTEDDFANSNPAEDCRGKCSETKLCSSLKPDASCTEFAQGKCNCTVFCREKIKYLTKRAQTVYDKNMTKEVFGSKNDSSSRNSEHNELIRQHSWKAQSEGPAKDTEFKLPSISLLPIVRSKESTPLNLTPSVNREDLPFNYSFQNLLPQPIPVPDLVLPSDSSHQTDNDFSASEANRVVSKQLRRKFFKALN